ncbi:uncharacterized protein, partial [Epargyreus clarus]|uniref:uncharacterized protein n=1 Tax=Epargyreus clarus TaxID=520877 RepID=UPI003C2CFD33
HINMNPVKYFIKDLSNKSTPFDVWLQGTVADISGKDIIISDTTGKVKVTGCNSGDGVIGKYYCVIGVAVKTNDIPEVVCTKIIQVNSQHQRSWESEVKEAQLFLQGKVVPKI